MNECIPALSDTHAFVESLHASVARMPAGWRNFFDSRRELIVTRAPGRLDLMGGIADYSGSLVLQWPIQNAVHVAIQRDKSNRLRIASLSETQTKTSRCLEINLDEFLGFESSADYSATRACFANDPTNHWAAYIAGA